jgi:hypothetical protein
MIRAPKSEHINVVLYNILCDIRQLLLYEMFDVSASASEKVLKGLEWVKQVYKWWSRVRNPMGNPIYL